MLVQYSIFSIFLVALVLSRASGRDLRSLATAVFTGFSATGIIMQISGSLITLGTWRVSFLLATSTVVTVLLLGMRRWPVSTNVFMSPRRVALTAGELVVVLTFVVLALYFLRINAFNQLIFAEDNAKWTNAAYFIQKDDSTPLVVNGLGGALFVYLTFVIALVRMVNSVLRMGMTTSAISVMSVWLASWCLVASSIVFVWLGISSQIRSRTDRCLNVAVVRSGFLFIPVLLVLQIQSFGFLTLLYVLAAISCSSFLTLRTPTTSIECLLSSLVILVSASFVWLPLVIVLAPWALLIAMKSMFRIWHRSRLVAIGLGAVVVVASWGMVDDRLGYLTSSGTSGKPIWRELLVSPGASPIATPSLVVAILGFMFLLMLRRNDAIGVMVPIGIGVLLCLVFVQVISATESADSSYTLNKLTVFGLLCLPLIFSQMQPGPQIDRHDSVLLPAAVVLMLLTTFGGDTSRTAGRLIDTMTQKTVTDDNRYWIAEVSRRLSHDEEVPVGCVSVDANGIITSEVQRDYFCTRALTGLAGGEERLIGLLAHSMRTFDGEQMVGSLEHYLGSNMTEPVMLLSPDGHVREVVAISELSTRLPNYFNPATP